ASEVTDGYCSQALGLCGLDARMPPGTPLFPYTTLFRSLLLGLTLGITFDQVRALVRALDADWDLIADRVLVGDPEPVVLPDLARSVEHTSELQSRFERVCGLLPVLT